MSILVTRTITVTPQQVATQAGVTPGKWQFRMTRVANGQATLKFSDQPQATFSDLVLNTEYTLAIARLDVAGNVIGSVLTSQVQIEPLPTDPLADVPAGFTLA